MGIAASDLCQHVIRPTLIYLERYSTAAEALLLGAAACQSALGAVLTASVASAMRSSGISTWHATRTWPARSAAWPASMPSSARPMWN